MADRLAMLRSAQSVIDPPSAARTLGRFNTMPTPSSPSVAAAQAMCPNSPALRPRSRQALHHEATVYAPSLLPAAEDVRLRPVTCAGEQAKLRWLIGRLRTSVLFGGVSEAELEHTARAMWPRSVAAGETVIRQGARGDNFYVVDSGLFLCECDGEAQRSISAGGSFGELALMYNCPRTASVRAVTASELWAIDRLSFQSVVLKSRQRAADAALGVLRGIPLFAALTDEQQRRAVALMRSQRLEPGSPVPVRDRLVLVQSGSVRCGGGTVVGEGGFFGEACLLSSPPQDEPPGVVERTAYLQTLAAADVRDAMGDLQRLAAVNRARRLLVEAAVPQLQGLQGYLLDNVAEQSDVLEVATNEPVFEPGDQGAFVYFVVRGAVAVVGVEPGDQRVLGPGEFWGHAGMVDGLERPGLASARASPSLPAVVVRAPHGVLLEPQNRPLLHVLLDAAGSAPSRRLVDEDAIQQSQLQEVRLLGKGQYGTVTLVRHVPTGRLYALKRMNKSKIVRLRQEVNVNNEREILSQVDGHPMLTNIVRTFRDEDNVYILLEAVLGGELFSHLAAAGSFSVGATRFYAAHLVLALEYLHSLRIVYRDLKPENCILDLEGYLKLTDMGLSKRVEDTGKTFTFCGTPGFLAPEVYQMHGHSFAVDWWALGVFLFECTMGEMPFAGETPLDIFNNIMAYARDYPASSLLAGRLGGQRLGDECADLCARLLHPDQRARLGSLRGGALDVKAHPFFADFPWTELLERRMPVPITPRVGHMPDLDLDASGQHRESSGAAAAVPLIGVRASTEENPWDEGF